MTGLLKLDDKLAIWIPPNGTADPSLQRLAPGRGARGKARQSVGEAPTPSPIRHIETRRFGLSTLGIRCMGSGCTLCSGSPRTA